MQDEAWKAFTQLAAKAETMKEKFWTLIDATWSPEEQSSLARLWKELERR